MKKILVTAAVVLAGMTMVGCSSTEDPDFDETVVMYHGKPIDCITWYGSHNEVGMTCDFVKWHKDND